MIKIMNIDDLNKRWFSLKEDVETRLKEAIKALGGSFAFVDENDESIDELDDLSELGLPLIDAYTYNYGKQGCFYVTSVRLEKQELEFYGVDENNCMSLNDELRLDYVPVSAMLDILENLPETNKQ